MQDPEDEDSFISTKTFPPFNPFTRDSMVAQLKLKSGSNEPLIVHLFVPLCDNINQGIVPVNASLGNGQNLKTNLYWGARYGIKSFLMNDKGWKFISSETNLNDTILERLILTQTFYKTTVILIADAYNGAKMKACLTDFLNSVAQIKTDSLKLPDSTTIHAAGAADLIVFNGHNGLMDTYLDTVINQTEIKRDVAVIGCASYIYFYERLNYAGGYPLITTEQVMAPEAYCLSALIEHWAQFESGEKIEAQVALAYSTYQKCSLNGAKNIFKTGW